MVAIKLANVLAGNLGYGITVYNNANIITGPSLQDQSHSGSSFLTASDLVAADVLSTEDIVVGSVIAVVLALTTSFLQGRRSQNDFVLWETDPTKTPGSMDSNTTVLFDAESWQEISQPDNYILYNRKLNEREQLRQQENKTFRVEKAWVLIALLALFVPIFSVEFFFALSRQIICDGGDVLSRPEWSQNLCAPANSLTP